MRFVPKKATYSTSLLRNANDQDKATFLETILNMVDVSVQGEVTIRAVRQEPDGKWQGYEFIRNDDELTIREKVDAMKRGELASSHPATRFEANLPRTIESDLREDR